MFDAPISPKPPLYDLVCSLLDAAIDEKGPTELLTERPEAVAVYLATHYAEIDLHGGWRHVHELVPLVEQWQTARRAKVPVA